MSRAAAVLRIGRWVLLAAVVLVLAAGGTGYALLLASLPALDGARALPGLGADAVVTRDHLGVVTVQAANRADLARALGFVHAQERFFQMDLLRRRAAGELSALVGPAALPADRAARVHRFRHRAGQVLSALGPPHRAVLSAYTAGVNAGLAALRARPFEYFLLRQHPEPWRDEDVFLAVYAMYFALQEPNTAEDARELARRNLPPALFALLTTTGSSWDAPLLGDPLPTPPFPTAAELAGWQPRALPAAADHQLPADEQTPGSNSCAVDGRHSRTGGALLASDMHLRLGVPNIWFRAQLRYPNPSGNPVVVTGVTLPGVPLLVAGSNGHIAWGFTNSYIDSSDLAPLQTPHPGRYLTPQGERPFEEVTERIDVAGQDPVTLTVQETIWGPVTGRTRDDRPYAYRWVAHDPEQAMNVGLLDLEQTTTAAEALAVAHRLRLPAQNFVVADAAGSIGWTIAGAIPRRVGWDGRLPHSWAEGSHLWQGYLPPDQYPQLIDPPAGRLWTANNRVLGGEALARVGDGGYDHGARAQQIRDDLLALPLADEKALLAIQLDDRARLLERWQQRLLALLDDAAVAERPARAALRDQLRRWSGHAAVDSSAYRLVRGYRTLFADLVHTAWLGPLGDAGDAFRASALTRHIDGYLLRLPEEKPAQLLPPPFTSWRALELAAADALIASLRAPLADRTWGERNVARIRHPLSGALPLIGRWLDAPAEPLPGDNLMPRVQGRTFGASQRMVVSPGHEATGIFHMPGGQSGHPLSPFYLAGHQDWAHGNPTPFLPGPPAHTLRFTAGATAAPAAR
jgi:penicillin amidase